jgi:hypothetical protein
MTSVGLHLKLAVMSGRSSDIRRQAHTYEQKLRINKRRIKQVYGLQLLYPMSVSHFDANLEVPCVAVSIFTVCYTCIIMRYAWQIQSL